MFSDKDRKNKGLYEIARQKRRGEVLVGCKNSFSKRVILVKRDNNKISEVVKQEAAIVKVERNKKETLFNTLSPNLIPITGLENVHSWIKKLFSAKGVPKFLLVERLKHFLETWKILTKYSEILELVEGYKITLHEDAVLEKIP